MNQPISSIMTTKLFTLAPHDTLLDAKKIFAEHRFHHIPIVRGTHLEGILSKTDLLPFAEELLGKMEVADVMTTKMAIVNPSQPIAVAAEIFLANLFHALPVVENDELVGLITTFDVIHHCFREYDPHDAVTLPDNS